jgi:5-methylcytosine-specific restriction endonuclease McrA
MMPTRPSTYKPIGMRTTEQERRRRRGSKHYDRRAWRDRMRPRILARDPICKLCGQAASTEVDHIRPMTEGGEDTEDNLRGVCKQCHSKRTRQDQNQRRRT